MWRVYLAVYAIYPQNCALMGRMATINFLFIDKGNGRAMIDGRTHGFGTNTLMYIPDDCPHSMTFGVNTHAYAVAIPVEKQIPLPEKAIILTLRKFCRH